MKATIEFEDCEDCPYYRNGLSSKCVKLNLIGDIEDLQEVCPYQGKEETWRWVIDNNGYGSYKLVSFNGETIEKPIDTVCKADGTVKEIYPNIYSPECTGALNHHEWMKSRQRYCERCGAVNNKTDKYCHECGWHMRDMDKPQEESEDENEELNINAILEKDKQALLRTIMTTILIIILTMITFGGGI